jgi:hypothetical protein
MRFARFKGGLSTTKKKIMKTFSVSGQKRESVGKKDSKELRSENKFRVYYMVLKNLFILAQ